MKNIADTLYSSDMGWTVETVTAVEAEIKALPVKLIPARAPLYLPGMEDKLPPLEAKGTLTGGLRGSLRGHAVLVDPPQPPQLPNLEDLVKEALIEVLQLLAELLQWLFCVRSPTPVKVR